MAKGKAAGRRVDWEAVKRDYRTSRYTQAELATKHKVDQATLSRKIKKDRALDQSAWPQDLTEAVRQATNARVMAEMVKAEVNDGQDSVKDAVKAAAEIGAQVILRHQSDLAEFRRVTVDLLKEVSAQALLAQHQELLAEILAGGEDAKPEDVDKARRAVRRALDVSSRVSSAKQLADAIAKLQERERITFRLDEKEKPGATMDDLSDDELERKIEQANERLGFKRAG
jgi:hypothetical protein